MSIKWLWIGICSILLCGCWDRTEINDLAIITAASVDTSGKKNTILLSVQILIPRAVGGSGGGAVGLGSGQGRMTMVRSSEGVNISDAMSKLQTKIPRRLFWGHCKVYLFGEATAKQGLADHIDFLVRHPEPRERSYLYISKGLGRDMLNSIPMLERSTAESLREYADLHIAMPVTLVNFRNMLRGEAEAAAIPMIENGNKPQQDDDANDKGVMIGTAIFKRDKMIGFIPIGETQGLLWLRGEVTKAAISVKVEREEGLVSIQPAFTKTRLVPSVENGKWSMLVNVNMDGAVAENGTRLNLLNPEHLALLQKAVQNEIDRRMKMALHLLQNKMKVDVVKFAAAYHRKYPKEWEKAKPNWNEIFSKVEVKTETNVNIRRPGMISAPAGLPQSEVKK